MSNRTLASCSGRLDPRRAVIAELRESLREGLPSPIDWPILDLVLAPHDGGLLPICA
jgi:hypothetical protein